MQNGYDFDCPYCGVSLSLFLDVSEGSKQSFVYDCEICCRPIQIEVEFEYDTVKSFNARTDDE